MGTRDQMAANEEIQGVFLPRLKSAILQTVSDTEPTMIEVPADAAPDLTPEQRELLHRRSPAGHRHRGQRRGADQRASRHQHGPDRIDPRNATAGRLEPPFTITVQAPGVVAFSTPVAVSYPNVDNAAPGTKMLFISFDHATGRLRDRRHRYCRP